jgi:CheY-like chemotaxis protein
MRQKSDPCQVLVIDDQEFVRDDIADIVTSFAPKALGRAVNVRKAADHSEVEGILQSGWLPDFVYLDNNLGGAEANDGAGLQAVAPLFAALEVTGVLTERVPIVMVTAGELSDDGAREFAELERRVHRSLNVVGLIRKPYSIEQILGALVAALTERLNG